MEAARNTWTDDRLDDLALRMEAGFEESRQRDRELRQDIKTLGSELRGETKALGSELRGEMQAGFAKFDRRFDMLTWTIVAAFLSAIASHFL